MAKIKDTDYLAISARIRAMETTLLTAERMERLLEARSGEEVSKLLQECGYPELDAARPEAMDAALNESFPTIFTSGSILASAGILISVLTTNPVISAIGTCLGRGTIVSILLVLFVLPQILILGDTIIERTSFEMKGVGGITRTASGTMHVNGRVRGYINGVVDAEIKGVLHGQFNASIATGTQLTVEKPDMYLSEENVREAADDPDTTDDTAKGGDAE